MSVFHVRKTKDLHPGSSGFIQDGIGPVAFESQEEAESFITVYGYEDCEVVGPLEKAVDLNNPGGVPQVGSLRNPALPGKQTHPLSIAVAAAKGEGGDVQQMAKASEQKASAEHPGEQEKPKEGEEVGVVGDAKAEEEKAQKAKEEAEKVEAEKSSQSPPQP